MANFQDVPRPGESALQRRLRDVPPERIHALSGTYRPLLGSRLFVYDVFADNDYQSTRTSHRRRFWHRLIA